MAKTNSSKHLVEIMFLGSVLVIVAAGFIIITSGNIHPTPVKAQVEGANTQMESSADMMNVLDSMAEDGSTRDLDQLKTASSGL